MIDNASKLAERVSTSMSRRGFFSWVGTRALGLTVLLGGAAVGYDRKLFVLYGGCCGDPYPWLYNGTHCLDSNDLKTAHGYACAPSSRCCGGSGRCYTHDGLCYSNTDLSCGGTSCGTPS